MDSSIYIDNRQSSIGNRRRSVSNEGFEPLLAELSAHPFGLIPRGKGADLNAIEAVARVRGLGGNQKHRKAAASQDLHQRFGVLPCSRGHNLDSEHTTNFPGRASLGSLFTRGSDWRRLSWRWVPRG